MNAINNMRLRSGGIGNWAWAILVAVLLTVQGCGGTENDDPAASSPPADAMTSAEPDDNDFGDNPLALPVDDARQIAPGITLIPDGDVDFVPNIGIIEGNDAVLVVDAGLGPRNGERAYTLAREIAGERELILTTTHFHPEHNFGAQAFKDRARIILNKSQAEELAEKGEPWVELFAGFGDALAEALEGTRIVAPDETYEDRRVLNLGGREVLLREVPGHTRGDQFIYVKDEKVLFAGDMVEEKRLPIMPDEDASGRAWIDSLETIASIDFKVLVPGHGSIDRGDLNLVEAYDDYLRYVQEEVDTLVAEDRSRAEIVEMLSATIESRYAEWHNHEFIPFTVAIFYAEATGQPPELPDL